MEPIKTVLELIIEEFELTLLYDGLNFAELTKLPWSDPAMTIAMDPSIDLAMDLAIDPVMDPALMDPAIDLAMDLAMDPVMDPALIDPALMDPAIDPTTTLSFPESEVIGEITATDKCLSWTGEI
jgi:hypothetical protein